jgi:2-polyprenyl-6-methoxyphenol hydroxylase-like FAD-dependent oxidoreductase
MYDAIIVGARCAGAPVAMLLARQGHKVLMIDRDEFPSDKPTSTHLIWQEGVARLKDWGLLDRLTETGCPPMTVVDLDLGPFVLSGKPPAAGDVRACYSPRRYVLDELLVDAALEAGAELHRGSVSELLHDENGVAGVRYSRSGQPPVEARARIVIGADGVNSVVAKMAGATSYNERPQLSGNIYAYFRGMDVDRLEFYARPGRMIYAWATNDGLTVAGMVCRHEDFGRLSEDPEASVLAELDEVTPTLATRMREATREGPWLKAATRNFCRKPYGPGWALVGDAGLTMDAISAAGISNAFRDADFLAEAVGEVLSGAQSFDVALADYERRRNEASMPIYEFTCEMAKLDPAPQSMFDLLVAMRENPEATSAYFGVFAQTVRVQDFFAPDHLASIMQSAAVAA